MDTIKFILACWYIAISVCKMQIHVVSTYVIQLNRTVVQQIVMRIRK